MEVEIGKEGLKFENGAFTYYGVSALTLPSSGEAKNSRNTCASHSQRIQVEYFSKRRRLSPQDGILVLSNVFDYAAWCQCLELFERELVMKFLFKGFYKISQALKVTKGLSQIKVACLVRLFLKIDMKSEA